MLAMGGRGTAAKHADAAQQSKHPAFSLFFPIHLFSFPLGPPIIQEDEGTLQILPLGLLTCSM